MKVSKRLLLNSFFVLGGLVLFQPAQVNAATTTQPVKQAAGKSKVNPSKQLTVEEAQRAVNQAKASLDKAVQAVTDAQNKVNSATSGHATAKEISDQQAVVEKAKNNIKDLEAAVKNDGSSVTSQKAVKATAQKALNAAQNEQKELQKDVATLSEQIKGDQAKLQGADSKAKAQEALNQANKALADNQASQAKISTAVSDLKTKLSSLDKSLQNDQSVLSTKDSAVSAAQATYNDAHEKLDALQSEAGTSDDNKITLPSGLNTDWLNNAYNNFSNKSNYPLSDVTKAGMNSANTYKPSPADDNVQVDPTNLTTEQQISLTKFAENLLNPIRVSLGYTPFTATEGTMNFTNDVISKYNEKSWNLVQGHYYAGIEAAAKDYFLNTQNNYYESAESSMFTPNVKVSMTKVKEAIYNSICQMLFEDSGQKYGHLLDLIGTSQRVINQDGTLGSNYQEVAFGFGIDKLGQLHFEKIALNKNPNDSNAYLSRQNPQAALDKLTISKGEIGTVSTQQLADAQQAVTSAQKALDAAKTAQDQATTNLANTKKQVDQIQGQLNDQNQQLTKLKNDETSLQSTQKAAQKAFNDAASAKPLTSSEKQQLQNDVKSNQGKLNDKNKQLTDANSKAATAKATVTQATGKLTELQQKASGDQASLTQAQTDLTNQQDKLKAMQSGESDLLAAQQVLQKAQAAKDAAQKTFDNAVAVLNKLKGGQSSSAGGNSSSSANPASSASSSASAATPAGTGQPTQNAQPTPISQTGTGQVSSSAGSSSSAAVSSSAVGQSSQATSAAVSPFVIYGKRGFYRYSSPSFTKANRVAGYVKKPMMYAPTFKVVNTKKSTNGQLRYQLSDGSYITTNRKFVGKLYPSGKKAPKQVYALAANGVTSYRSKKLSQSTRARRYKQGTRLAVQRAVRVGNTLRYQLKNGRYISASRKLVSTKKFNIPIKIRAKRAVTRYRSANLTKAVGKVAKNTQLKLYGWNYTNGRNHLKSSHLVYRVAGGYVTGNAKLVSSK